LKKSEDGVDDRFRWRSGCPKLLYGLWRDFEKDGYTILVEGESDCHTLWLNGFPALGIPGATGWKEDRDALFLKNVSVVYVIIEPDKGGETVKKWLSTSSIRDKVKLVSLGTFKDPSGLYLDNPELFKERFHGCPKCCNPLA